MILDTLSNAILDPYHISYRKLRYYNNKALVNNFMNHPGGHNLFEEVKRDVNSGVHEYHIGLHHI